MKKVMVIDDNEADQFLNKLTLQRINPDVEIMVASDGVEALELLEACDDLPDVILLDINMPRMNGHEFLAEYNKNNDKDVPPVIVMLTSSAQEKDKHQAMEHNCVKDYLLKPMSEELAKRLEDYLS